MAKSFAISSADLNKAVYTAIASAKQDPALDVLAGVTGFMLLEDPALTKENILREVNRFQEVITSNSTELHGAQDALDVSRLLTKIAPSIDAGSTLQKGFRNYTLEFYKSYRQGVELFRQVESIESQSVQFDKANRFRRTTWERLFELSSGNLVIASAINESQISVALGFEITDDAQTQLQKISVPSLSDFISTSPTANGQLQADVTDIENRLALLSNEALELDTSFATNIIALNRAEQNLRDKRSIKALKAGKKESAEQDDKEEQTELEKAIKFAEEKQKELDKILNKTRSKLKTTLDVFAFIAAHGNDEEFAEDIKLFNEASIASLDAFRKYSENAIDISKGLSKILGLGATGLTVLSSVGLTVAVVAVGIKFFSMLNKKPTVSTNQRILEQLQKISVQLRDFHTEMRQRFDRIERQLNTMFDRVMEQFDRINFELGQIDGNVIEIQFTLHQLQGALLRINSDIHLFLEVEGRRDLVEAINGFLNFQERTGQALGFENFLEGENIFFSWGVTHSQDALQAGPDLFDFSDTNFVDQLSKFPIAFNINFLREIPATRFELAALSSKRLANPTDWITSAQAYAQLCEESPSHAANISSNRINALIEVGEHLNISLSKIENNALFTALANHYNDNFSKLKEQVKIFEDEFRSDTRKRRNGLFGIDLWGGPNQMPVKHFFSEPFEMVRCDGKTIPTDVEIDNNIDLSFLNHSEIIPYLIAGNLLPGSLNACINANWITQSVKPIFGERVEVTFQLIISVDVNFEKSKICAYSFQSDMTFKKVMLKREFDTFKPNKFIDPYSSVHKPKEKLAKFRVTQKLTSNSLQSKKILSLVQEMLSGLQRKFYREVAEKFEQDEEGIAIAGRLLSGSKLLWRSFVIVGFPLSIENNDHLRALLFGSDAILAGSSGEKQDSFLDNLQSIYSYFSVREELPPDANIIGDIETVLTKRVENLVAIITAIIEGRQAIQDAEVFELFAPIILRLKLINSRTA